MEAPTNPERAPMSALRMMRTRTRSVQKRAAAGGMMSMATIKISPTAWRPETVTRTMSARMSVSMSPAGMPVTLAKDSLKQTMVISFMASRAMAAAMRAMVPMRMASLVSMAAVWP